MTDTIKISKPKVKWFRNKNDEIIGVKIMEEISDKDFFNHFVKPEISKALIKQRTSIIKEIEKQRDKYDQDDMIKYQALDDIIKEINK